MMMLISCSVEMRMKKLYDIKALSIKIMHFKMSHANFEFNANFEVEDVLKHPR